MSKNSRVPDLDDKEAHLYFLDGVDRRQLALSQITDVDSGATLGEVITALNLILASHRTK